jgi:hypothetical protein
MEISNNGFCNTVVFTAIPVLPSRQRGWVWIDSFSGIKEENIIKPKPAESCEEWLLEFFPRRVWRELYNAEVLHFYLTTLW